MNKYMDLCCLKEVGWKAGDIDLLTAAILIGRTTDYLLRDNQAYKANK